MLRILGMMTLSFGVLARNGLSSVSLDDRCDIFTSVDVTSSHEL